MRLALARKFEHREMAKVSKMFGQRKPAAGLKKALGGNGIPSQLVAVADAFVELQQAREDADYNLQKPFSRPEVLRLVEKAEATFQAWRTVRHDPVAILYLLALLDSDRLVVKA